MTGEKPFIHMISTPMDHYLYDVNTNMFAKVDGDTYQYLKEVEQQDGMQKVAVNVHIKQEIEFLRAQGFLSIKHPQKIRHSHSDLMEYHLNENIMQMALQVTQQCNFRCAYCIYGDSDFEFQREHSSKRMTLETALTAVDFFAARCGNQENITLGFYGGEPLLEFPLIQEVVKYAEEKLYAKDLSFTITTNASLLTPDIACFLCEHNFITVISLDGTPETHDRSRRFAKNGKGSFSVIRKNLVEAKKICPDFQFSFNTVVDARYPCDSLHQLFSGEDFFKESHVESTSIDDQFSVEKVVPSDIFLRQNNQHIFKGYLAFRGVYNRDSVSRVAYMNLLSNFGHFQTAMRSSVSLPDEMAPGGPCIAGERRLFVSVDGNLYPCEKVSETSEAMIIGNLWDGFDMDKVDRIINVAQTTAENCKKCWAFRHCMLCCRQSDNCGELCADLRRSQCDWVRSQVENIFKDYLWTKEFGIFDNILNKE